MCTMENWAVTPMIVSRPPSVGSAKSEFTGGRVTVDSVVECRVRMLVEIE